MPLFSRRTAARKYSLCSTHALRSKAQHGIVSHSRRAPPPRAPPRQSAFLHHIKQAFSGKPKRDRSRGPFRFVLTLSSCFLALSMLQSTPSPRPIFTSAFGVSGYRHTLKRSSRCVDYVRNYDIILLGYCCNVFANTVASQDRRGALVKPPFSRFYPKVYITEL